MQPTEDHPHVPGPSLWPVGFAVGVVVFMVGLIISWWIAGLGALLALAFAFLWVRDLTKGTALALAPDVEPKRAGGADIPFAPGEPLSEEGPAELADLVNPDLPRSPALALDKALLPAPGQRPAVTVLKNGTASVCGTRSASACSSSSEAGCISG